MQGFFYSFETKTKQMKNLLLLFAMLFIAFSTNAQLKFKTKDLKEVRQLADSIALTGKTPYKYTKEGVSRGDSNYYVVLYTNENDDFDRLGVAFWIDHIGRNIDLEIEGTPVYTLDLVKGNFLDLLPFWKRHINQSADAVKITKETRKDKAKTQEILYILQDAGGWEIRRRIE